MQFQELLSVDTIACDVDAQSKKRALECLSSLIADQQSNISSSEVFDSLINREKLGSTGIGHGAAIPHGRLDNCDTTIAAFIRLKQGIDFDAIDSQPVDLLFALIVPVESTNEHLQTLALLASMFNDQSIREKLRKASSAEAMLQLLTDWQANQ